MPAILLCIQITSGHCSIELLYKKIQVLYLTPPSLASSLGLITNIHNYPYRVASFSLYLESSFYTKDVMNLGP